MKSVILLLISINFCVSANEIKPLKSYLKAELSDAKKTSKETISVSSEDQKLMKDVAPEATESALTFYYARDEKMALMKACTVVGVRGKEGPMTVGICFEPSGMISRVRVLAHEEEKGKRIEEESFLKQFNGKKVSDAFVVGKDVDGISGATWSSKAVAEAVRKGSFVFDRYIRGKK